MKQLTAWFLGAVAVAGLVVCSGGAWGQDTKKKETAKQPAAAESAPAAAPASGQYKIGVVSRKDVVAGWDKVKAEQKKLEDEKADRQKGVDALFNEFDTAKKAFDAEKDSMSPSDRTDRQSDLDSKYRKYQQKLQAEQTELDGLEREAMRKVFTEIDEVVSKIGAEKGYHIIFEGSSKSGAIYYSPTIDISQQVIDELNKKK